MSGARRPLFERTGLPLVIDLLQVVVLHLLVTFAFAPVFGGSNFAIAGIGGTALGIVVGVVSSMRPLRGWLQTAAGVALAFVLFGPALAVRHSTLAGFIPTPEALRELLLGVVFSWKGLLTAEPPADGFPSLLVVPFLLTLVSAALGTVFALRLRRWAMLSVVPPLVSLAVAIAFGTKTAAAPLAVGLVAAGVAFGWAAWRSASFRRSLSVDLEVSGDTGPKRAGRRRRSAAGAAMVVGSLVIGAAIGGPVQAEDRQVLRDAVQPPVDLEQYPSPLAGFRSWHKQYEDETLLTVTGAPEQSRMRLATFDAYNGTVFAVAGTEESGGSGSFSKVGTTIGGEQSGVPANVQIEIGDYSGIWLPDLGYARSFSFSGDRAETLQSSLHYNSATGAALTLDGVREGDRYTLEAVVPEQPGPDDLEGVPVSQLEVPDAEGVPDLVQAFVAEHGSTERTTLGNIIHLQQVLQAGAFSHGLEGDAPSLAGHGAARIESMLRAEGLLGDDEQYATLFALSLQAINVPARVVMGFYPYGGFDGDTEPVELTGADLHAWVEIPFEGFGWVAFDPSPPEDQTEVQPEPEPKPDPQPRVLQPPQPPEEPVELQPDTQAEESDEGEDDSESQTAWIVALTIAASVLGVLLLLALPFLVLGLLKRRRRTRRRTADAQHERLSGGWHELVDQAVDLGLDLPHGVTRNELAGLVAARYPEARATEIGAVVDEGVFGPEDPAPATVDALWSDVDASVAGMRGQASRGRRLSAILSMRSFRRHRRSERRLRR